MKEYDRVKVTAEKEKYAKFNVHKDMVGWICDARVIDKQRLVCFDECDLEIIPIIPIDEKDLEVVWESHERQVGDEIVLLTNKYNYIGIYEKMCGILLEKRTTINGLLNLTSIKTYNRISI